MAVVVGSDGAAKFDFGNGLEYVANILTWRMNLSRNSLRQTNVADEAERRTAGLADWTGDFGFQLQFSDDTTVAQSSWQMLEFAFNGVGDELKADLSLILQRNQILPDYDIFNTSIAGVIKLTGTVVILDVSLDCTDPEQPIALKVGWAGDGALALQRD